jgi:hypothetical protein
MKRFAETTKSLLTNARCLTEGVDIPAVDSVLFADPKQSVIDIVQAAGRALRPHSDKRYGYIILPIIVPDDMGFDEFAATTEFRQIARTVAALSTQDERIAEEFRISTERRRSRGEIIQFDGDVPAGMEIDFVEFADQCRAQIWRTAAKVNWRKFEEAREFVRSLGLASVDEWREYSRSGERPDDIPAGPRTTYENLGWAGFGDWLGTGRTRGEHWRPFEDAREFARSLELSSSKEWRKRCKGGKLPVDVPRKADRVYKNQGWAGWGDWLGSGQPRKTTTPRSFEDARRFARSLGLKSWTEWWDYSKSGKRPADIPAAPSTVYRDQGWAGISDWLGAERTRPGDWLPFKEAREFVWSLGLKSEMEWRDYSKSGKRRVGIPSNPDMIYKDKGWVAYSDWLGTGVTKPMVYRPFEEAREFVRRLGLKSTTEWYEYSRSGKRPKDIPSNPNRIYKDQGWAGYPDWLRYR